jgi:acetate---CoA ligase (ADP-forming)
LAAGFADIGPEGAKLGDESLQAARDNNVRLIGPNTNGVFNLHNRMNFVGVRDAEPGDIGIVSQSGNMSLAFITEGRRRGVAAGSSRPHAPTSSALRPGTMRR